MMHSIRSTSPDILGSYKGPDEFRTCVSQWNEFLYIRRDHDTSPNNCANNYGGGWWWNYCHYLCLNGKYGYENGIYPAFGYRDFDQNQTVGVRIWRMLTMSRMMVKCT